MTATQLMPQVMPIEWWLWRLLPGGAAGELTAPASRGSEANGAEETNGAPPSGANAEERTLAREVFQHPERFEELYRRYYERILNFFWRRVRERALAEDLTSQVFLAAMEYLAGAERDVPFRAWLYRIATNAWITHERQRTRWGLRWLGDLHRWLDAAPPPLASQALADDERRALLRRALMALPTRYREAILLRYEEGLSVEEIGVALGLTEGGVRSRVSRGLKLLRRRVRPLLASPCEEQDREEKDREEQDHGSA